MPLTRRLLIRYLPPTMGMQAAFLSRLAIKLPIAGSQAADGAVFQLFASGSPKQILIAKRLDPLFANTLGKSLLGV